MYRYKHGSRGIFNRTVPGELWYSELENNWDRENQEAEKAQGHSWHPPGLGIPTPSGT